MREMSGRRPIRVRSAEVHAPTPLRDARAQRVEPNALVERDEHLARPAPSEPRRRARPRTSSLCLRVRDANARSR
jgi:hypothetical protein